MVRTLQVRRVNTWGRVRKPPFARRPAQIGFEVDFYAGWSREILDLRMRIVDLNDEDTAATLPAIADDLTAKYRGVVDEDSVHSIVRQSYDLLAKDATVTTYLPVLTARAASERLDALVQAEELVPDEDPGLSE
ncbi:MAG: hypothetical protein WCI74_12515 [Actinomycetes bacterium]